MDINKIDEYSKQAKEQWGDTEAFKEYEERVKNSQVNNNVNEFMNIFVEFGKMKEKDPSSDEVQAQVKKLQEYITAHYYTCTKEILSNLGKIYVASEDFTKNIDKFGGEGTALFVSKAIEIYCRS